MRRIVVLTFVTLDGVMQAPGGPGEDTEGGFEHGGWTVPYFDDFLGEVMAEQMSKPFELLLGRKTFELFASYWPYHQDEWPGISEATKYVASNTLTEHGWSNTVFLKGDATDQIKELRGQSGPDLQVHGSSNLIQSLLRYDLVDRMRLKIFPLTLGSGKRLFAGGAIPAAFTLTSSLVSPKGVIIADYARSGEVTGSM
jgi:dihydrofolate reductase